jgi:hypothetical protein
MRTALIFLAISSLFMLYEPLSARQVGKFCYKGDIENLKGDTTIVVSDTMVAVAEKVRAFGDIKADTIKTIPSIFFIIDNSSSMAGTNGNDVNGNRFTVTSAFIDTLRMLYPMAEVGLAVFSGGLYYNPVSKAGILTKLTASTMGLDDTGAFVPLLSLSQTYGTQTGYEVLRELLATDSTGYLTYPSILASQNGTNINSGFDAALQAFSAAKYPLASRFIIFLSDGAANQPSASPSTFTAATSCPTSFTIYFTSGNNVPTMIQSYTNNCKVNGYSTSNPNSNAWAYNNTTFQALMDFLMANVLSVINRTEIIPATLTINTQSSTTWLSTDSTFNFGSVFPLTGEITPFNVQMINAQNVMTTTSFIVQTQGGLPRNWRNPYDVKLWDRDIVFQSTTGVTVTTIFRDLNKFQVRFDFDPGDANYVYTKALIELFNTNLTVRDREIIVLTKGVGNYFTGQIDRTVAASAIPSNNVLEHAAVDTLIAVFRNIETPKLPLDTFRTSIPLMIAPNAVVLNAATKDYNGNGFIDAINITFDQDTSVISPVTTGFSVKYGTQVLTVIKVERTPGGTARQWRLLIHEPTGTAMETAALQTSWTPTLRIMDYTRISNGTFTCADSCPPVIYRAIKVVTDLDNRANDTLKMMFSEEIRGATGAPFAITNPPPNTFAVWWGNTGVSADSMLNGISNFNRIVHDSIIHFIMTNKKKITSENWMNIETSSIIIRDKNGNAPVSNNRKVPVEVQSVEETIEEKPRCGCGSGIFMAFLPPLYFKVRSEWGRRKKRAKPQNQR